MCNDCIDCVEIFKIALKKGINLFTGARFSKLPNLDGNILPDANELYDDICESFSVNTKYKNDLERLSNISVEEAQRIINLLNGTKTLIFIDQCCDDVSVIELLMQQNNFYVLSFTDDYAYESTKHLLDSIPVEKRKFGELSKEEAQGIFNKVPERGKKYEQLVYKTSKNEKFSIGEFSSQNIKNMLTISRVTEIL